MLSPPGWLQEPQSLPHAQTAQTKLQCSSGLAEEAGIETNTKATEIPAEEEKAARTCSESQPASVCLCKILSNPVQGPGRPCKPLVGSLPLLSTAMGGQSGYCVDTHQGQMNKRFASS